MKENANWEETLPLEAMVNENGCLKVGAIGTRKHKVMVRIGGFDVAYVLEAGMLMDSEEFLRANSLGKRCLKLPQRLSLQPLIVHGSSLFPLRPESRVLADESNSM